MNQVSLAAGSSHTLEGEKYRAALNASKVGISSGLSPSHWTQRNKITMALQT